MRTLAIDPTRRGFAFVVIEGHETLLDWGIPKVEKEDEEEFYVRFGKLLDWYRPRLVVVEDLRESRRGVRAQWMIREALVCAGDYQLSTATVTRARVKRMFQNLGSSKHEIARALAEHYPELANRLPPKRKLWKPESERMSIFVALSFAVTVLRELEAA